MARSYLAVIERGTPDQGFGVVFPDLPGCFSAGDTFEKAVANAAEALDLHLECMLDDGDPIPPPGSGAPRVLEIAPEDEAGRVPVFVTPQIESRLRDLSLKRA